MLVSVIIPVYNVEAYLRECLDSVIVCAGEGIEMILVDDASTDSSGKICDSYGESYPWIKVVRHGSNRGPSAARNTGIDIATGDALMFVDSDDLISESLIPRMTKLMETGGYDIVSCDMRRFNDNSLPQMAMTVERKQPEILSPESAVEMMLYQQEGPSCSVCCKLFRRSLFDGRRFREGSLYEDMDISYRLYLSAGKCCHIVEELYFYRDNPNSIINTFSPRRADVLDVTERMESYMVRNHPTLAAAASDRSLSAAFNILGLMNACGYADKELADRCWGMIRKRRLRSLLNPKVRLKNKAGILLTYIGGRPLYLKVAGKVYGK